MQVVQNKALQLKVKNPERITSVIPKSAVIHRGAKASQVLVKWGLDEARVLANLGIKNVPSPILGQYNWPGMYKPFDHQRATAAFLTMNPRAYCFNEQGTGKSAATAWAAEFLMVKKVIKRTLIICPVSTMQSAWQADLFRTLMHRKVAVAYGDKRKRIEIINSDAEFVIINPDGVAVVAKELAAAGFDLVVIDEATCVKNANTTRWKFINKLVGPNTWLWMLTGTPASQSPLDAYGLARMMNPRTAPRSFTAWRDEVMYKATMFKWTPKSGWRERVFQLLQPAVRYTKDDCLDLPPKTYSTRDVPMSKSQEDAYNKLRTQLALSAAGETITAVNAASGMSKLLQCAAGAIYSDNRESVEFDITPRYKVLLDIIAETDHKVLVFVPFTNTVDRIAEMLNADGITADVIDGRVAASKRNDIIQQFQMHPDPRVLVLQPQAVSHGITLHAANVSVWWGPVTSQETYAQANDRMHRAGQKNPCTVINLQGCPAERIRYKALQSMADDQHALLSMYREMLES